jgi:hypothetical protein
MKLSASRRAFQLDTPEQKSGGLPLSQPAFTAFVTVLLSARGRMEIGATSGGHTQRDVAT